MALEDTFKGDTLHLIDCIDALVEMSDKGVIVPHGLGGHARTLLSAAAVRLLASLRSEAKTIDMLIVEQRVRGQSTLTPEQPA